MVQNWTMLRDHNIMIPPLAVDHITCKQYKVSWYALESNFISQHKINLCSQVITETVKGMVMKPDTREVKILLQKCL